ncbi:hypothetical protein RCO12_10900 [Staphylococcus coagulans]|uniref:DUF1270 family protein n=1 Tax=Staphylococcus coagulans TaxID=74706 RepID=A0ABU1F0P8_9STAP|nr:hypothetical protein [Staphylococcus coagulans]MDR5603941.1 hypothetical protein [Staphylococcus coagulans]MDR9833865.1 hypothetical protein [Staphylococcus coagulans]
MKSAIALFMTAAVAFILTTVLVFAGVYFTTILFVITVVEIVTYYGTYYTIEALKKTEC